MPNDTVQVDNGHQDCCQRDKHSREVHLGDEVLTADERGAAV
jgi:hypothetical protein